MTHREGLYHTYNDGKYTKVGPIIWKNGEGTRFKTLEESWSFTSTTSAFDKRYLGPLILVEWSD